MTTGIDRDEQVRQRRWAAEQLGLPEGAGPEDAHAAFVRLLPEADFVPPSSWCQAVALLSGIGVPGASESAHEPDAEEEDRLRDEIEEYAGQYWSLSLGERRQRWQALFGRCGFAPALRTRLEGLRPGLVVGPLPEGMEPEVAELAQEVRTLFVLRPAERAASRQALLLRMRARSESWEATAQRLHQQLPTVAALESGLIQTLATWSAERSRLARMRRQAQTVVPTITPDTSSGKAPWAGVWIIFVIVGAIVRGLSSSSHPTPKYEMPKIEVPQFHFPQHQPVRIDPNDPLKDFPPAERERIRESLRRSLRSRKQLEDRRGNPNNPDRGGPWHPDPRNADDNDPRPRAGEGFRRLLGEEADKFTRPLEDKPPQKPEPDRP